MFRGIRASVGLLALAYLVASAAPAQAQDTWNGGTSNNWSVGTNWSVGAPVNGTDVVLTAGAPNAPSNYDLTSVTLHSITLNNPGPGYTINLTGGTTPGLQSGGSITNNNPGTNTSTPA